MHISIEAVGVRHSGGAVVLADLLDAAQRVDSISRITIFTSPRVERNFDLPSDKKISEIPMAHASSSLSARIAWYSYGLKRAVSSLGVDLMFASSGMGTSGPIPHVTFIQQAIPFSPESPSLLSTRERIRFWAVRRMMAESCSRSRAVFVQTPTMREWVSSAFSISESRFSIYTPVPRELPTYSPENASHVEEVMQTAPKGARILYVGSRSPHKNLKLLSAGMATLRRTLPNATLFLTSDSSIGNGTVPLGYLDPAQLGVAYLKADLVVQPSLIESGPLIMGEAMSLGRPVLVADRPYAHDMCEDSAIFFDPHSPHDFAARALEILSSAERQQDLIQRGFALTSRRRQSDPFGRMANHLATLAQESRFKESN